MKKRILVSLVLILVLGIVGAKAVTPSAFQLEVLEKSPFYSYDAIEKVWSLGYTHMKDGVTTGLVFGAYGTKDGTLKMPVFVQGACLGYYANEIAIVIDDKVHRIGMTNEKFKQFYVFENTEPLFAAMKDADEITVRTYNGAKSDTFTISGDDYIPLKEYINVLYESGVISLSVNHQDSNLFKTFLKYTVE